LLTFGLKRFLTWSITSCSNSRYVSVFRVFMMRTMTACGWVERRQRKLAERRILPRSSATPVCKVDACACVRISS
jgi:hypothetical protein